MIVVRREAQLLLVTQPDHAHFAVELLGLRRHDGLNGHPRREDILFAAREHDNGWREADAAPRIDASAHRPLDFRDCPTGLRHEIWLRGAARYADSRPYASLLIAEHALALHRERTGRDWEGFLARILELQEELAERSGCSQGAWLEDYRFLAWADAAALAALGVWPRFDQPLGRGEERAGTLRLDPFPLAGGTHFDIACRWIPDRPYPDALDLARTLAESRWTRLRVGVLPW